jgi:hypothetical protein
MNILIITPDQYRGDVVHFTDRVFNTTNESAFSRITQCDDCVMINGISILLPLSNVEMVDKVCRGASFRTATNYASYSKKNAYNLEITRNIQYIEQDILRQYGRTFDILDKQMCLNLSESLIRGKIKIATCSSSNNTGGGDDNDMDNRDDRDYDDKEDDIDAISDKSDDIHSLQQQQQTRRISNIILKISGIWETENEYGLTYKYSF